MSVKGAVMMMCTIKLYSYQVLSIMPQMYFSDILVDHIEDISDDKYIICNMAILACGAFKVAHENMQERKATGSDVKPKKGPLGLLGFLE